VLKPVFKEVKDLISSVFLLENFSVVINKREILIEIEPN